MRDVLAGSVPGVLSGESSYFAVAGLSGNAHVVGSAGGLNSSVLNTRKSLAGSCNLQHQRDTRYFQALKIGHPDSVNAARELRIAT